MLTSKFIRGMTTFRKVKPDVIEMVIVDPNHNVHIQIRDYAGTIEHEATYPMTERSVAMNFCGGFLGMQFAS